MITIEQYFGGKPHTQEHEMAATDLLFRVNMLIDHAEISDHFKRCTDLDTGTEISGSKGGAGDGGFRLPTATTGKALSSHKEAKGVDVFDPSNDLDDYLTDEILTVHGLYREHPDSTPGWCHLTTRAPHSGKRTFLP